jgi:hypothetical protein
MAHSQYKIDFSMSEKNNPLDKERGSLMYNFIVNNPFGKFEEMRIKYDNLLKDDYDFVPFDETVVSNNILSSPQCYIILRSEVAGPYGEPKFEVMFSKSNERNFFSIMIDREDFVRKAGVEKIEQYIRSITPLFTKLDRGSCAKAINFVSFYHELKIEQLSPAFSYFVQWIHIIGPGTFEHPNENIYKREDLLNAPAYSIEEWDNGFIFMKGYEDPFEYNTSENRERIIRLNAYLDEKIDKEQW